MNEGKNTFFFNENKYFYVILATLVIKLQWNVKKRRTVFIERVYGRSYQLVINSCHQY